MNGMCQLFAGEGQHSPMDQSMRHPSDPFWADARSLGSGPPPGANGEEWMHGQNALTTPLLFQVTDAGFQ
jgi:hypothetical protein